MFSCVSKLSDLFSHSSLLLIECFGVPSWKWNLFHLSSATHEWWNFWILMWGSLGPEKCLSLSHLSAPRELDPYPVWTHSKLISPLDRNVSNQFGLILTIDLWTLENHGFSNLVDLIFYWKNHSENTFEVYLSLCIGVYIWGPSGLWHFVAYGWRCPGEMGS